MTDEANSETPEEAEGAEGTEGEEGGGKKSKKKLFIIIGAAALVLILGGGAAAYFLVFAAAPSDDESLMAQAKPAFYYEMEPLTVNLNTEGTDPQQFLKLSISLEFGEEAAVEAAGTRIPQITDTFQVYLRELRRSDLEGSAGIYRLKEELRRRVNLALFPIQIEDILFKEILVQ